MRFDFRIVRGQFSKQHRQLLRTATQSKVALDEKPCVDSYTDFITPRRDRAGPIGLSAVCCEASPVPYAHLLDALRTSVAIEPNSSL